MLQAQSHATTPVRAVIQAMQPRLANHALKAAQQTQLSAPATRGIMAMAWNAPHFAEEVSLQTEICADHAGHATSMQHNLITA